MWNDHPDYSFSFLLIRKQSLFNPSSQTRQFNSFIAVLPLQLNPLIWRLDSFLFTMQLSILIHNAIPESSYLKHEWILSLCILCLHSTHTIITYPIWVSHSWSCIESSLLSNKSTWYYIHYWYSNKQVTIILNPSTNQVRVIVATLQQLFMCSLSRYHTIVNHEDDIYNRAQTMCHHSRMSLSPRLQCRQERILILTVQRTRRLVQKENRGITQNRSRQRQTLLLTTRYRLSHCS